jgi:hypothetical protein
MFPVKERNVVGRPFGSAVNVRRSALFAFASNAGDRARFHLVDAGALADLSSWKMVSVSSRAPPTAVTLSFATLWPADEHSGRLATPLGMPT